MCGNPYLAAAWRDEGLNRELATLAVRRGYPIVPAVAFRVGSGFRFRMILLESFVPGRGARTAVLRCGPSSPRLAGCARARAAAAPSPWAACTVRANLHMRGTVERRQRHALITVPPRDAVVGPPRGPGEVCRCPPALR